MGKNDLDIVFVGNWEKALSNMAPDSVKDSHIFAHIDGSKGPLAILPAADHMRQFVQDVMPPGAVLVIHFAPQYTIEARLYLKEILTQMNSAGLKVGHFKNKKGDPVFTGFKLGAKPKAEMWELKEIFKHGGVR